MKAFFGKTLYGLTKAKQKIAEAAGVKPKYIYRVKIKMSLRDNSVTVARAEVWETKPGGGGHRVIDSLDNLVGKKYILTLNNIDKVLPAIAAECCKSKYGQLHTDFGGDAAAAMYQIRKRLKAKERAGIEQWTERYTTSDGSIPALENINSAKKKEIAETIAEVAKQVFDNLRPPVTSYVSWVYDDAKDDFLTRDWQDACSVIRVTLPTPNQGHDDPRWKQIYEVFNRILSRLPANLKSNFQPALGADSGDFYISI